MDRPGIFYIIFAVFCLFRQIGRIEVTIGEGQAVVAVLRIIKYTAEGTGHFVRGLVPGCNSDGPMAAKKFVTRVDLIIAGIKLHVGADERVRLVDMRSIRNGYLKRCCIAGRLAIITRQINKAIAIRFDSNSILGLPARAADGGADTGCAGAIVIILFAAGCRDKDHYSRGKGKTSEKFVLFHSYLISGFMCDL